MARKTKLIRIGSDGGRDASKCFWLTEMSAPKGEKWATKMLLLAAHSGADIPKGAAGMAAIAVMGIQALLNGVNFAELEPLLDEMMLCVTIIPDMMKAPDYKRPLIEDDIEEISTLLLLRNEVLMLHLGFSLADSLSTLISGMSAKDSTITQTSDLSLAS